MGKKVAKGIGSKRKDKPASGKPGVKGSSDGAYNQQASNKKTRIGKRPDMPFNEQASKEELTCPKCQYYLRTEPSISSPCPNCGFSGNTGSHDTRSDRKTIDVSGLNLDSAPVLSSFSFNLVAESTGSTVKIESEESELTLNRDHLDPGNTTISSDQHILTRFQEGHIYMSDVSSSGSTFIQVLAKSVINPGTRIVLGNKVYLFSQETAGAVAGSSKTQQFTDLNTGSDDHAGFALIEESSGKKLNLVAGLNVLNRKTLDPGNASISGSQHATLEHSGGQWLIADVSSNKATFIQVKSETLLSDQVKLIIGNIVFRFEC